MDITPLEANVKQETQASVPSSTRPVEKEARTSLPNKTNILSISNILLVAILMLLICNLSATAFLGWQVSRTPNSGVILEQKPLPAVLSSKAERVNLFDSFRGHYNNQNNDELYNMMHPLVQVQFSEKEMKEQAEQIYDMFGPIDRGAYSHYEYRGDWEGKEAFDLYYQLNTEKMGNAILRITVVTDKDEPMQLWGFNITSQ